MTDRRDWAGPVAAMITCLAVDYFTPRGVADGALYVLALLLTPAAAPKRQIFAIAAVATALNGVGFVISAPLSPWWMGPFNRLLALGLIWGVALLTAKRTAALRRAEAEHRRWMTTVSSMGDAVLVTDALGHVTFVNAVAERIIGLAAERCVNQPFDVLMPLANAQTGTRVDNPLARVLAEGRVFGMANHTVLLRQDGGRVAIDDSAAPLVSPEGTIQGAVIVFRDVSERYESEARLAAAVEESRRLALAAQSAEQTLDALMRFIPEGITVADAPDVKIRIVSRYGVDLIQRDQRSLLGTAESHASSWGIVRLDDTPPTAEELPLSRAVMSGEIVENELWKVRRPDGSSLIIACNAGPIKDTSDRVTGGLIAWRDVTRQYEMEEALKRQALALASHDRVRSVFVSMVSHELRQPLGALQAAVQVLRMQLPDPAPERLTRPLQVMERQTGHLSRLVNDLIDAARITQGKFTVTPRELDFTELVRRVCEDVGSEASAQRVTVAAQLPSTPIPMLGDAGRLRQVVSNLLVNAVRHAGPDGLITCSVDVTGHELRLTVQDTGKGIAADVLPHLFEMFVQGEHASESGLGLGLTIAKGIVDLHHGTIQAENVSPLGGARFIVTLPVLASAADRLSAL